MRRIGRSILKRINLVTRGKVSLVKRRGCRFLLSKHNRIDNRLLNFRFFEADLLERAVEEIHRFQLNMLVDIGANFGLYACYLNKTCGPLETLAFEPVSRNFNQLCGNLFANDLSGIVKPYQLALSDQEGSATIHVELSSPGVSTLEPSRLQRTSRVYAETETVRKARFDNICDAVGRRAFVKIDVEGHEVEVLRGMQKFLENNTVSLQIEVMASNAESTHKLLDNVGYTAIGGKNIDRFYRNFS